MPEQLLHRNQSRADDVARITLTEPVREGESKIPAPLLPNSMPELITTKRIYLPESDIDACGCSVDILVLGHFDLRFKRCSG